MQCGILGLSSQWHRIVAGAGPTMVVSDAAGWVDVMDCEMDNLSTHDVYELVLHMLGMRTIRLSWVLHRKFKNGAFDKNKAHLVTGRNPRGQELTMGNRSRHHASRVAVYSICPGGF